MIVNKHLRDLPEASSQGRKDGLITEMIEGSNVRMNNIVLCLYPVRCSLWGPKHRGKGV